MRTLRFQRQLYIYTHTRIHTYMHAFRYNYTHAHTHTHIHARFHRDTYNISAPITVCRKPEAGSEINTKKRSVIITYAGLVRNVRLRIRYLPMDSGSLYNIYTSWLGPGFTHIHSYIFILVILGSFCDVMQLKITK